MEKTKLGISVKLLAAITCLAPLSGGYVFFLGLVLYILLMEKNEWLKKMTIQTVIITFVCSALSVVLDFVPSIISVMDSVMSIFGQSFSIAFVSNLFSTADRIVTTAKLFVLLVMSLKCFTEDNLQIKQLDDFMAKHVDLSKEEE
ncbi:MAG: hypothetical protein IJZ85_00325 [Lachnospiraceae bacterium]|nr:hypothetical protein [Lachnospiraceae bacterium]